MREITDIKQTENAIRIFCAGNQNFFIEDWNKKAKSSIKSNCTKSTSL